MKLDNLREKIDKVDEKIIKLIAKRFSVVEKIKSFKRNNHIPVFQKKREEEILNHVRLLNKNYKLSEKFIIKIWKEMLEESKTYQQK